MATSLTSAFLKHDGKMKTYEITYLSGKTETVIAIAFGHRANFIHFTDNKLSLVKTVRARLVEKVELIDAPDPPTDQKP